MLFGMDLSEVIRAIGVLGIAAIVFAESGMMVGFFLPGDTLLFTAGFLASQGTLGINVHILVPILFVSAILGDNIGYYLGQRFGRRLFQKEDSVIFHKRYLEKAEKFYARWGAATIIVAKFTPLVRTFAPVVAGISSMSYRKYVLFDLIGCALWVGGVTYIGYFGGAFLESNGINVEILVVPVILAVVLISLASPLIHILKDPKSRKGFLRRFGIKSTKVD